MSLKSFFAFALSIALFPFKGFSSDTTGYKSFALSGFVSGMKEGTVYLYYDTEEFGGVWDSSSLKNGVFQFKGKVNEPTVAEVSIDRRMAWGINTAEIFLESGTMMISASRDSFYALTMEGSASQKDQEKLSLTKRKTFLDLLEVQRAKATAIRSEKDSLRKREQSLYNDLALVDSFFIIENPRSFVTAHLLKRNVITERIHFCPLDPLYDKLPAAVKKTSYGRRILWQINKVQKVPLGEPAPRFSGKTLTGQVVDLKDFKGKDYVLLDFWASWCGPCRQLTPFLRDVYKSFQGKGFQIISVAIADKEENWKKAIAKDSSGM